MVPCPPSVLLRVSTLTGSSLRSKVSARPRRSGLHGSAARRSSEEVEEEEVVVLVVVEEVV